MSAATEAPAVTEATAEEVAAATVPIKELFRYSSYVHIGAGAQECEIRNTGTCTNEDHFHAWIRLPNPFQIRDIVEKARAAQARTLKALRDPESDPSAILEAELAELESADKDLIVSEIVDRDFQEDYQAALRTVSEIEVENYVPEEDEDMPRLYAHIDQDREEYHRRAELPEEQRGEDFAALEQTVADYSAAVEKALDEQQEPRRAALAERPLDELIDLIRRARVESLGTEQYLHTFNTWTWFVCTFKPKRKGTPNERVFPSLAAMKYETPPEVIGGLKSAFEELEQLLGRGRAAGKS